MSYSFELESRVGLLAKRFFFIIWSMMLLVVSHGLAETYRVGIGDVLDVTVYDHPDLSSKVRVGGDGTIPIPLVGALKAQGLSVEEISAAIEERLADGYLVAPHVNVFIQGFEGHKAVVLGQVNSPGMVELRGPTTLLEIISLSGGLTSDAGHTATITRAGEGDKPGETQTIDLNALLKRGDVSANIRIQDRDNVFIEKVAQYYIMGQVKAPGPYKLNTELSVIDAVNRAGGFTDMAAEKDIEIQRVVDGKRQKLEDADHEEKVRPHDVIVVPESFF